MAMTPFEDVAVLVADDESTWHGPHIHIFVDDAEALALKLPEIIQEAKLLPTLADNTSVHRHPLPLEEPEGGLLVWPCARQGMILPIHLNAPGGVNELLGFYPWVSEGVQHRFRLEAVGLFPSRLEARLSGFVGPDGEMSLTFFDTQFARNRSLYQKNATLQVILIGIPSSFSVFVPEPITITDLKHIRAVRPILYADDPEQCGSDEPLVYATKGMAAFFPRADYSPDYYEFSGPVRSVAPYAREMFGRPAWRVRVTVARFGDEDFDLDLCVSEKTLGAGRLPEPGEDVRGVLWLQGYLWWVGGHDALLDDGNGGAFT